jgi:hypothetical protein
MPLYRPPFNRKLKVLTCSALCISIVFAIVFLQFESPQRTWLTILDHSTLSLFPTSDQKITSTLAVPTPSILPSSALEGSDNATQHAPSSVDIVISVDSKADLRWLDEINSSSSRTIHRYNYDDTSPPPEAWFPANKGHEAMMYLSYIIANYESLPDYTIFIHGHRQSWHQEGDMVHLISNLRLPTLSQVGYIPLRCDWYPSCPAEIRPYDHDAVVWGPGVHREDAEREIGKSWKRLFGAVQMPRTIASQCCAQFAVTRAAIQSRHQEDYLKMREWLLRTDVIDDISGRVFEKLWAYIMTGEATRQVPFSTRDVNDQRTDGVRCPPPQQCACQYFGQCAPKSWPIPPKGLAKWDI